MKTHWITLLIIFVSVVLALGLLVVLHKADIYEVPIPNGMWDKPIKLCEKNEGLKYFAARDNLQRTVRVYCANGGVFTYSAEE